ncbi:peptidylprolyl isomerase ROF1-like [Panicum miliaceum]|uniref:peptidylprolyl isomerase n=1 Tax=Panicum miliaceum TaxID=4540 RepID=A0A3L6SGF1_PANMI|nr:peptidylprolyl isomerase ROF1-like [Panicum miliaceum]
MEGFSLAVSSMHGGEKALFIIPTQLALTKSGCPATVPWNIPPNQTLWFDIELISITTDILGDQGIMKKTTKFGAGEQHPCDLDEVSVKYNACLMDGTLLSKSEGVEFSLVDGFFCSAFVHAVKTMTEGDEAFLIIKPEWPSKGNEAAVPPDATLHVNLQLMSWKTVSLIGEDQKIVKTTFGRANFRGKQAQRGAVMKVRLIGKLQDGIVFDRRGDDGDEPFEFTIDEEGRRTGSTDENFVSGLEEAVMTMEEGEVASVIIPPQHAYGTVGSNKYPLAVIPPNSVLIYEIELLSINIIDEMVMFGLSRRKLKQGRQRGDQDGMIVVPPAAWPQGNASHQPPVLAPPAAGVAQSPPAIIGATTTIDPSTGTASKRTPGLGSCFGFSSSSAN